jgi:hypothetical protein
MAHGRGAPAWLATALLLACLPAAGGAEDLMASPGTLASVGKQCFGENRRKWVAATTLVGAIAPRGLEAQLQLGRCLPLITAPGDLFDYTNFQYGLTGYLSPVYAMPGAFVSIAPLSVIELRAEAEYIRQWPIGLDAAGYFPMAGYGSPWKVLPAAEARQASGYTVNFTGNLQAEVSLADRWSLLALNTASWQLWQLGDAPYYYNARNDFLMARREWMLREMALVLVNHDLTDRLKLRAGLTDDLSWVRGSGYVQNVVGALLTGVISGWPGPHSETQPFLRVGGYTAHAYRKGQLNLLVGVGTTFDLSIGRAH